MERSRRIVVALCLGGSLIACDDRLHEFERNPSDEPLGEPAVLNEGQSSSALSDGEVAAIVGTSIAWVIESGALVNARASLPAEVRAFSQQMAIADGRMRERAEKLFAEMGVIAVPGERSRAFEMFAAEARAALAASDDASAPAAFLDGALGMDERSLALLMAGTAAGGGVSTSQGGGGGSGGAGAGGGSGGAGAGGGSGGSGGSNAGGGSGNAGGGRDAGVGTMNADASGDSNDAGLGTMNADASGNSSDAGLGTENADASGNSNDAGLGTENADAGSNGNGSGTNGNGNGSGTNGNGNGSGTNGSGTGGNMNGTPATSEQLARSAMSTSHHGDLAQFLDAFRETLTTRMAELRRLRQDLAD